MCGKFDVFGNTYALKDADGNIVGEVKHNATQTSGEIVDNEGNVIATYKSAIKINDYTVNVYENDMMSDEAVLMIMASFVSDMKYDK